jgi:hypothetical protein
MRRTSALCLLSLAAWAAGTSAASAGWHLRLPFVGVGVGGDGVHVRAPFVDVQIERDGPEPPLPGGVPVGEPSGPLVPLPAPRVVPPPPPAAPVVVRPMTLAEFAACFRPVPGTHEVVLLHTRKGCPVRVCFTLPPGCPRVRLHRHELEFDYGKHEVSIRFQLCGKVKVDYD